MKSIKALDILLIGLGMVLNIGAVRAGSANQLSLVKDGVPTATIVAGKNLSKVENYAVQELQTYLKKIAGVQIPISNDSEEVPGCKILVGTLESNPLLKSLRNQLTGVDSLGEEGFLVKTLDNNLVIAGGGSGGVLYGVYTFLEKYLGCRWYFPGEEGEIVPKQGSITLGEIADIQKPSLKRRELFMSGTGHQYDQSIIDWMARNKMNGKKTHHHVIGINKWLLLSTNQPPETQYEGMLARAITPDTICHSFWWLVPADEYYDKHPEYYSLINGKRMRPKGGGVGVELCLSNPEVQKIVVEKTRNFFAEYPKVEVMGVSPNDNYTGVGFCECENCKAFGKSQTDRLVNFVNIVAKEIYTTNLDKYIGFMAYSDCTPPPSVKPLENVMVEYVRNGRCYKHSFDDPECKENAVRRAEIKGWLEKVKPDHFLWGDFDDCQNDLPEPTAGTVTKDLKLFSEMGMAGFVQAVTPASWDVLKLHRYVLAKTAWDKNLKYKDILDDFCRKYYGPAGEPMKKYYQALDEAVEGAPGCFLRREIIDVLEKALTPTILRKLKGYLIETQGLAEKAVAENCSAIYAKRIGKERMFFDKWTAFQESVRQAKQAAMARETYVLPLKQGLPPSDGDLSQWETGPGITNFIEKIRGVLAQEQTSCWLRYDQQNLYVIFKCHEPDLDKVLCGKGKHDGPLWEVDDVEFFIDTDNDQNTYYQFGSDSAGNQFDISCGKEPSKEDIDWSIPWKVRTSRGKDCWYAEMSIPLKEINLVPKKGDSFGISLNRCRHAGQPIIPSAWPNGRFGEPKKFGKAIFE